ncbi:hypothetical protein ANN_27100 [Periplaneta americana]|uniref:Uncharacterized protein n=1 Tax=Periplaneta americana TaxID=6978 RepID=A0ABQ8RX82_PERAM|nr:hypothetical protein ANN_27100 [Periplaneta americana]
MTKALLRLMWKFQIGVLYYARILNVAKVELNSQRESTGCCYSGRSDVEDDRNYKILSFEIIDNIIMQIDKRFGDLEKLRFVSLADTSKFDTYSRNFPRSAFFTIS